MTLSQIPNHIAIIPDGNRRWAKKNLHKTIFGHRKGSDNIMKIALAAKEKEISTITFYLFSTENWSRPKTEIALLMDLLLDYIKGKRGEMIEHEIQLETIGDLSAFSKEIQEEIALSKKLTQENKGIRMVFALNYGSRSEICNAFQKMMDNGITKEMVTEEIVSAHLDTANWKDPDLLIRTSEVRLSNFMLWQLSYAEFYMTDTLWPDFTAKNFHDAIDWFKNRKRRHGG